MRKKRAGSPDRAYFVRRERGRVTGVARVETTDKKAVTWYRAQSEWKPTDVDGYLNARSSLCFC